MWNTLKELILSMSKPKTTCARKNAALLIIPNTDLRIPSYARMYEELKGLSIGGCISTEYGKDNEGKDWSSRKINNERDFAHAHSYLEDPWYGWICSPHKTLLTNKWCLLHEVAHLIANNEGHSKRWKETVVEIGGSLKPKSINWLYKLRDYTNVKENTDADSSNK